MTLTPEMAKALRLTAGMSQAEFAAAIGMSRETVGRMERGREAVEHRTELAMRYVAERGPIRPRSLADIYSEVADTLEQVAVRGQVSLDRGRGLRACAADWNMAGGGAAGAALLLSAQGVVGMLNSTPDRSPLKDRAFADLRELKLAWHALSAGSRQPEG
jgi:DNA-binding XRE family transcriptional regulator